MSDDITLDELFNSAVTIVKNLPKEGPIKPPDDLKLKFYAYYKQVTCGPNNTSKPRFYQIVESYKWEAWYKLGQTSKDEAMSKYVAELESIINTSISELESEDGELYRTVLGGRLFNHWFSKANPCIGSGETNEVHNDEVNFQVSDHNEFVEIKTEADSSKESVNITTEISHQFEAAYVRLQQRLACADY